MGGNIQLRILFSSVISWSLFTSVSTFSIRGRNSLQEFSSNVGFFHGSRSQSAYSNSPKTLPVERGTFFRGISLQSSFYDDFEDFVPGSGGGDDDDDNEKDKISEDDEGEYESAEEKAKIEMFRTQMMMGNVGGLVDSDLDEVEEDDEDNDEEGDGDGQSFSSLEDLISFASAASTETKPSGGLGDIFFDDESTQWAKPLLDNPFGTKALPSSFIAGALNSGTVLLANPEKFCSDIALDGSGAKKKNPLPNLLSKFGLTLPPPPDLGPDRRADLLPVLILLDRHPLRGSQAVLLNRRTGYLLGDLEQQSPPAESGSPPAEKETPSDSGNQSDFGPSQAQPSIPPKLGAFMIQPLWFGGTSAGSNSAGGGLDMLHQCPPVKGCRQLTDDGLYWGGDPVQAQDAMADASLERPLSGFEFKFFVQSTRWLPTQVRRDHTQQLDHFGCDRYPVLVSYILSYPFLAYFSWRKKLEKAHGFWRLCQRKRCSSQGIDLVQSGPNRCGQKSWNSWAGNIKTLAMRFTTRRNTVLFYINEITIKAKSLKKIKLLNEKYCL
jgi:hypothetical protein